MIITGNHETTLVMGLIIIIIVMATWILVQGCRTALYVYQVYAR